MRVWSFIPAFVILVPTCGQCGAESFAQRCQNVSLGMTEVEASKVMVNAIHAGENNFNDREGGGSFELYEDNCSISIMKNEVWSVLVNIRVPSDVSDQQYLDDIVKNNDLYYLRLDHSDFKKGFGEAVWGNQGEVYRRVVITHWSGSTMINDFRELPTKLVETPVQRGNIQDLIISSEPK